MESNSRRLILQILLFIIVFIVKSSKGDQCNKFVHVESTELYSYLGRISFVTPKSFNGRWKLQLKTDKPFAFLGCWGVSSTVDGDDGYAQFQSIESVDIKAGQKIEFRIRLSFAPNQPVALAKQLIWEDQLICLSTTVKDSSSNAIVKQQRFNEELLKDKLSPCREIFPILLDIFIWKKDIYPCVLTAFVSLLFGLLWYLNPSVITGIAVLGLSVTLADFFLPALSQTVISDEWNSDKEKKFSIFCNRIAYYSVQLWNFQIQIEEWKQDTPNLYASFVVCSLLTLAWIGNAVNNLILLYLVVLFLTLLPGLLQRRFFSKIVLFTANLLGMKRKSN